MSSTVYHKQNKSQEIIVTKLLDLYHIGQSVWLDYIRRSFINSGELQTLIDSGIRGMTSNPSIFEKAIAKSSDYDDTIALCVSQGQSPVEIYETLAIEDIQSSADLLLPVYHESQGNDGFVSLEVSPHLAYDTSKTVSEATRLWEKVNRSNLMIKIPATRSGLPAITETISNGINVNTTLIFSSVRYEQVLYSYIKGLEQRLSHDQTIDQIASVASIFVSRIDSKVDTHLDMVINEGNQNTKLARNLKGKIAVSNSKIAYKIFKSIISGSRFRNLVSHGAKIQKPLWASTSTKNPEYSDIKYVQELIGTYTVNTLPQNTINAFLDHGKVEQTLDKNITTAETNIKSLEEVGISLDKLTKELESEGVSAFANSYDSLITSIAEKREIFSK